MFLTQQRPNNKVKMFLLEENDKKTMAEMLKSWGVFYVLTSNYLMTTLSGWCSLKEHMS